MRAPRKRGFGGLIIPFLIAAVMIAGYWFYWREVAARVETQVRDAIPASVAKTVKVTGFPYRLTLELGDVVVKGDTGLGFSATQIDATATPFNPLLWVLESAQEPAITWLDEPSRPLKANGLKASLRLNPRGLERLSVTFDSLDALQARDGPKLWGLGAGDIHLVTDPKDPNILAARVDVKNIDLGQALEGRGAILGQVINRFMIAGPISQGPAFLSSASDWHVAGGQMTIMAGEVLWGPVSLTQATGQLRLNAEQKWQGQIQATGALKPEGLTVAGLSAPVSLDIIDNKPALSGLPGIDLTGALPFGQ